MRKNLIQVGGFYWLDDKTVLRVDRIESECGETLIFGKHYEPGYDSTADTIVPVPKEQPLATRYYLPRDLRETFICLVRPDSYFNLALQEARRAHEEKMMVKDFFNYGAWEYVKQVGLKLKKKNMWTDTDVDAFKEAYYNKHKPRWRAVEQWSRSKHFRQVLLRYARRHGIWFVHEDRRASEIPVTHVTEPEYHRGGVCVVYLWGPYSTQGRRPDGAWERTPVPSHRWAIPARARV